MKKIKKFEDFVISISIDFDKNEGHQGEDTSWTDNGFTITLHDVNDYLDENGVPVENIDVKSIEDILIKVDRDPERVDNADLDFPIIVSKKDGKFKRVLDGQHRAIKSIKNGLSTIKARILDLDTAPDEYKEMFK